MTRLGWSSFFEDQIAQTDESLRFARVVEEQRGLYRIAGHAEGWAEVSGLFRHEARTAADFPAVGDWVCVAPADVVTPADVARGFSRASTRAIIHRRLERRSVLSRAAAGDRVEQQVVAANVDTVFLVSALAQELNVRRIERYLTMVWDAGAVPVVLLNKADLADDPVAARESVRARLPLIDVVALSALSPLSNDALDTLAPYLRPAHTIALLGSSGVGKSTLVNRLLGRDAIAVAPIRESDGKGRHTTTSRQLVELPCGALLIDTPGMRELHLWGDESAVDTAFDDVAALSRDCRFADCGHAGEPGCAVQAAVDAGRLDPDRLANYQRLLREAAFEARKHDTAAAANVKRRWKHMTQAQKALYKSRERLE
ncbi:MAG: ribosome small subunit-dependent GTPase A [Acidobacteria bacterium]|nr:ribosome small subunit-dependent GTPase A [Acidobacteriota bacterium]